MVRPHKKPHAPCISVSSYSTFMWLEIASRSGDLGHGILKQPIVKVPFLSQCRSEQ